VWAELSKRLKTKMVKRVLILFPSKTKQTQYFRFIDQNRNKHQKSLYLCFNPKTHGGGGGVESTHRVQIWPVFLQLSSKLLIFFWWKLFDFSYHQHFFWEVEDDRNRALGGTERGHPFFRRCILAKKVCSQELTIKGKRRRFVRSFTKKKNSESFDEN
jgi:hypothetical protein